MFNLIYNQIETDVVLLLRKAFAEVVGLGESYHAFRITSVNKVLVLTSSLGGTNVVVTLTEGYYYGDAIATMISARIAATPALVGTFIVTYDWAARKIRITISTGTIRLVYASSTAALSLGFTANAGPAAYITSQRPLSRNEGTSVSAAYKWTAQTPGSTAGHRPVSGESLIYIGTVWETSTFEEILPSIRVSCPGGGQSLPTDVDPDFGFKETFSTDQFDATSSLYPSTPTLTYIRKTGRWADIPVNIEVKAADYTAAGEIFNMVSLFFVVYARKELEDRGIVTNSNISLGTREVEPRGEDLSNQVYKSSISFTVQTEWEVIIPLIGRWLAGVESGRYSTGSQQPLAGLGDVFLNAKVVLTAY